MDPALFGQLLAEGEGSRLDYKQDVYEFQHADIGKKSEILKDVLSLANAWRNDAAFILFGVEKQVGRPTRVVGVTRHLDDASLKQFINTKTNRPILFAYHEFSFEGHALSAIRIPLQGRPFYLTKPFGPLRAHLVYVRFESSNGGATPDDVYQMGADSVHQRTPPTDPPKPCVVIEWQHVPRVGREVPAAGDTWPETSVRDGR